MADILIVVPARGGSKRLPGKNIRPFAGRSLIAHAAEAIADSDLAAPVLLTTDDETIAAEGRRHNMQVPFLRPAHLASDTASTADTVLHALDWFRDDSGADPEMVMVLQPTSPLRGGDCLRTSVELLAQRPDANSIIAMTALDLPPSSLFQEDGAGVVQPLSDDTRRPVYVPNGALYLTRTASLRTKRSVYADPIVPLIMDPRRSIDIDTPADWDLALALLTAGVPDAPAKKADHGPVHSFGDTAV